jgi:hypothetical protein
VPHCVGQEHLTSLDLLGGLLGKVEVDVKIVIVGRRIHWDVVLRQLFLVVQVVPVTLLRKSVREWVERSQLVVILEEGFLDLCYVIISTLDQVSTC